MGVRFYAGAPLVDEAGAHLGTLCVLDRVPRRLSDEQRTMLVILARQVMSQLAIPEAHVQLDRTHALLQIQYDLRGIIADSDDLRTALRASAERMCRALGWQAGGGWLPSDDGSQLMSVGGYFCADPRFEEFRDAWLGLGEIDLVHPDDWPIVDRLGERAQHEPLQTRWRIRAADGGYHWVDAHTQVFRDAQGCDRGLVTSLRVVDDQVEAQALLARRAREDQLTGLLNSGEALRQVATALDTSRRRGEHVAVLFCDVDKFKTVNDTLGHAGGDAALRIIAERIRACTRTTDIAARMGGDEFMVVLTEVSTLDAAVAVAEKIRGNVSRDIELDGRAVRLSVSIGVTLAGMGESIEAITHRADTGMYAAKQRGRDQVVPIARG